jgi:hypothetical protein
MNKVTSALRLAERIVGYASPAWHVGAFLPTLRYGVRPPWEAGSRGRFAACPSCAGNCLQCRIGRIDE